jgi:hypothetical protein
MSSTDERTAGSSVQDSSVKITSSSDLSGSIHPSLSLSVLVFAVNHLHIGYLSEEVMRPDQRMLKP